MSVCTMAGVSLISPKWWSWSPLHQESEDEQTAPLRRARWSRTGEQKLHVYMYSGALTVGCRGW